MIFETMLPFLLSCGDRTAYAYEGSRLTYRTMLSGAAACFFHQFTASGFFRHLSLIYYTTRELYAKTF